MSIIDCCSENYFYKLLLINKLKCIVRFTNNFGLIYKTTNIQIANFDLSTSKNI